MMPIYRDDAQRSEVMAYVNSLREELTAQTYADAPIRVEIDDRDIRGGEKKWYHVKRGVPIRIEVGPKDIEKGSVFMGRRDKGKSEGVAREECVKQIGSVLAEMQQGLFDRAKKLRDDNTVSLTGETDFRSYFTPKNTDNPELHGGFAFCHFSDEDALEPLLKELKVTIRCIPRGDDNQSGTCFLTGKPATQRAIFAKAY